MTLDDVMSGDYVLGMWDEEHAAIIETESDSEINIYPNPAEGKINIELKNDIKGKVVICNQLGQIVREMKINDKNMTINLDGLSSGIYTVNVMNKKNVVYSEKVVVR